MPRPTHAIISIPALAHNLARARELGSGARVWAVLKANGYGHGLLNAMRGFERADGLALVEFDMAARLREAGWRRPILMLEGPFEPADVRAAAEMRLSLVLHDASQAGWIENCASGHRFDVYLKFNSGMNRLGLDARGLRETHARLSGSARVESLALMTHFANADVPGGAVEALRRFEEASAGLAGPRSMANSAAVFDVAASHRDWVRPGVMLYGATPFADRGAAALGLRPAMRLRSRLIAVRNLAERDAVGYGSKFVAPRAMRVGVVACGYADGYPRHAPTGTPVAVDGVRTRTLGRVSMDMLCVDLEPAPSAAVGSEVELWGDRVPIDDVAASAGTIGYELMCALATRVELRIEQ